MDKLDKVDQKILSILRKDGRASHATIAKEVGLSAPAVGERIRKLEQQGTIQGYQAVLSPEALGLNIASFVAIIPQPRSPASELVDKLTQLPEVEELHAVAGDYSYIMKVRVENTQKLDVFLDRLFMLEGVERTQATIILKSQFERPLFLPFEQGGPKT
ncbi:MAG: Lrp/AsnC family transcriptional regulator [Deinococcales bacterium]